LTDGKKKPVRAVVIWRFKEHIETEMTTFVLIILYFELQLVNQIVHVIILTAKK
jgi:hypothetical protein